MDHSFFQLYKKSPFQFNNTPFILGAPATYLGKLSDYVKNAIGNLETFYTDWYTGANPLKPAQQSVNGEETEFFLSTNFDYWKELLKDSEKNAGTGIKKILSELKKCNLMSYTYAPQSLEMDENGAAIASESYSPALSYYFDVLQVDLIPPSAEDLEARSTDPKPYAGNTVKGFADVVTFKITVRRNKMLEAYINGDFDDTAPKICGGAIVEASRGFIMGNIPAARFSAYKAIQPTEGNGEGYKSGFFERLSPEYKGKFYCVIVGTTNYAEGVGEETAVFVTANYDANNKAEADWAGAYNIDITAAKLGAAKERKSTTNEHSNTFSFTPYAVYIVPRGCFMGDPEIDQSKVPSGLWIKEEIITENGQNVPVVQLRQQKYKTLTIGRPVASFETLTIGTARTRVKLKNLLSTEARDDAATDRIKTEELQYNAELNNVSVETKITNGSRSGVKIILHVSNAEYDITNDFSGTLSVTNISKAQIQAEATARATNFVQQGAGVVLGGAAVVGGIVTGNIPAVVAGVSGVAGSVSGIIQNTQRETPRQTATQTGVPDGLENITTFDGVYFETFTALNAEEIKRVKKYKTTFENAKNITIIGRKGITQDDREELTTAAAIISAGSAPEEVKTQITNKLNGGAVICYSVQQLKEDTGTE